MKRASLVIAFVLACAATTSATGQQLLGSGSTFVYPILAKWSQTYQEANNVHIEYQPIGSSGGLTEIKAGVVDFGISDAPLDGDQLLRDGLAQFPLVIGAIVPVVNIEGLAPGQLHLTGKLLADIYLGKVKNWSDPAISAVNPDLKLADRAILVVHRSDGSGTTYNWTDYLSKVSGEWKLKVGIHTMVAWPTGVGVKGNSGVAEAVARVKGAIGYVEYGYAQRKKLTYGVVRNRAGNFVPPGIPSFQAATVGLDWTQERDFNVSVTDAEGTDAYPLMAVSFVLVRRYPQDAGHSQEMLNFFRWALEKGQDVAASLDYLPLPPPVVQEIEGYWNVELHSVAKSSSPPRKSPKRSG